jgi:hypothetical protein
MREHASQRMRGEEDRRGCKYVYTFYTVKDKLQIFCMQ